MASDPSGATLTRLPASSITISRPPSDAGTRRPRFDHGALARRATLEPCGADPREDGDQPPIPSTVHVCRHADGARPIHAHSHLVRPPRRQAAHVSAVRADTFCELAHERSDAREAAERRFDVEPVDLHSDLRRSELAGHRSEWPAADLVPQLGCESLVEHVVEVREPVRCRPAERVRQIDAVRERPHHSKPGRCCRNRMYPRPAATSSRRCATTIGHTRLVLEKTVPKSAPIARLPRNPPHPWYRW